MRVGRAPRGTSLSSPASVDLLLHPSTFLVGLHALVVAGVGVRVVMRRPGRGVALAWLGMVATFPLAGVIVYLLIGERRISGKRAREHRALRGDLEELGGAAAVDWSRHAPAARGLDRLGHATAGAPTVAGSRLSIVSDSRACLEAIARDLDQARSSVLMEFYIWNEGGAAATVLEALERAAARGVRCRVLVDAVGVDFDLAH